MSLGTENGLSVADIAAVTDRNNGNCGGLGMGGDWLIALIMLFLFPMIYGGGMFGGGMWGGMGGWGNGGMMAAANGALTRADLCSEFNFNGLESAVRGVTQGLCDGFYAMQGSINGLGTTVMQGFSQAELSRASQQAALMQQLYQMGYNQQDCCCRTQNAIERSNYDAAMRSCETGRAIEGVKFTIAQEDCATRNLMQSNTRDVIDNDNRNHQALMNKLCQMEYNGLNDKYQAAMVENQALKFQISQSGQNNVIGARIDAATAEILRRTGNDCPVNAVVVQPSTPVQFPTNCCGQFNGWGNSFGNCA